MTSECRPRDEIRVASRSFNGSLLASQFSYGDTLSVFRSFMFDRSRSDFSPSRSRTKATRHNATTAFPNDKWDPDRFLLRRRALYSRQRRRHGAPPDEWARLHFVCAFLARRNADRVHFGVRWQQGSL